MTFNPQYPWFFGRFNRGVPDKTITFYGPIHENDPDSLEMELQRNEELFLSMQQTAKSPSAWLTTKRFIWDNNKEKHQLYLKEIAYVRLEILNKPDNPSDNPDYYDLALQIRTTDANAYIIGMPNIGVLNGFLSVFAGFALWFYMKK